MLMFRCRFLVGTLSTLQKVNIVTLHEVITVAEAARISGWSPRWVRRLCENKAFNCRSSDAGWLIDLQSFQDYLKHNKDG